MGSRAEVVRPSKALPAPLPGPGQCKDAAAGRRKAPGRFLQAVFQLIPDGGAPQGLLHDLVQLHLGADAVGSGDRRRCCRTRSWEGVGLLEHHAHPLAQQVDVNVAVDVLPSRRISPVILQPSTRSFIRFRDSAVWICRSRKADESGHFVGGNVHVHGLQGLEVAVVEVQVFYSDFIHKRNHPFHSFIAGRRLLCA